MSEDTDDAADAVAWARANVGTCRQPPDVDREPVQTELAEQKLGLDLRNPSPTVRASQPSLVCELYTYLELADRADALADWLIQARRALIDPLVSSYGEQVIFPSGEEPGPPYGVAVVAQMKSVKGRWSRSGGDSTSWDRALKRLRAGELHYLGLDLIQLNGEARSSHYRHGIDIKVEVQPRPCELSRPRARTTRRPCRTC